MTAIERAHAAWLEAQTEATEGPDKLRALVDDAHAEALDEDRERSLIRTSGVYDLTFPEYLADPVAGGSLTSTGARTLINRTPAHYHHERTHPRTATKEMDLGSVAHDVVLGKGKGFVEVEFDSWRTNAAKAKRDEAEAEGKVALLSKDVETVLAMAEALRTHPLAAALLDPARGRPEQTVVWQDPRTGVWCRALVDFLWHPPADGETVIVPDFKTTTNAHPEAVAKQTDRLGYHVQGAWYQIGVRTVYGLPDRRVRFALISQEVEAPYLVSVGFPDADAVEMGKRRMREALDVYASCRASGVWPGYGDEAHALSLPAWATRELREAW